MRQSNDQQRQFRETIDSHFVGQVTGDLYSSLMQCRRLRPTKHERFYDATLFFSINKQIEEHDKKILRKSKCLVANY